MKLLKKLKAFEMLRMAWLAPEHKQNKNMQEFGAFMRKSKITLNDLSPISAHFTAHLYAVSNSHFLPHACKWHSDGVTANRTSTRKRTCGLRVFSKAHRVRGFALALGAFHWHRIKFHTVTPNVD